MLMLARCGAAPSGGIVDNGNTPREPDEPHNDPENPDSIAITDLVVLNEFLITAPSQDWKSENKGDATTISHMENAISFSHTDQTCGGVNETTQHSIEIYWCESGGAILGVGTNKYVLADFSARSSEVESILRSFRRK
jgi:hypothetical protein